MKNAKGLKKQANNTDWVKGRGAYSKVTPSLVLYGLWYPGLAISLLLILALCAYQFVGFLKTFNYSALESVIFWILGAFWYGLCLANAYRIRKGKKPVLRREGRKALQTLNASSAFIVPSVIFIGMVIAIFAGAPWNQALIGIVPSGAWIAWGIYLAVGMKKDELTIEDFAKGEGEKEEAKKEEKASRLFRFVTSSFALKYCYYPGLLGGFAAYLVLAGFRGGFDAFSSPTGPNIKGFLWTLLGILLYVWAITNLFRIRGGKKPLFHYSPRRAFHAINTRSAVDMPLALIGILWSMGAKAWTVACIVLILLFMAWGVFVEVGCYKNGLVPEGFVKAPVA